MIRNWFGHGKKSAAPAVAAGKQERKSVLIIDDHSESLLALCHALAGDPYDVETADSAAAALDKLSRHQPDVVLMDSQVPASDGTRLARRLLMDEDLASVPIVNLAVSESTGETIFDATIPKPIDPQAAAGRLRSVIDTHSRPPAKRAVDLPPQGLAGGDRRQGAERVLSAIEDGLPDSQFAAATGAGLERLAAEVGAMRHYELGDYLLQAARLAKASTARARSRFRSMIRLCRELVQQAPDSVPGLEELRVGYLENRRADLDVLDAALRNRDFGALRKIGHNIKGTGAAYGFAELTDLGRALEAASNAEDAVSAEALLDRIESYIAIVQPPMGR